MSEFRMPALGADMQAGTLVQWLKQPGDRVQRGDIVAVVETEKGAIEIEVFEAGVLDRCLVEPGQKVPVGTALAMIRADGEAAMAPGAAAAVTALAPHVVRASPAARKAAEVLGVDLTSVTGTGPGGAVSREDVERAAARRRVAVTPGLEPTSETAARMRVAIAAAMSRSKREIPHLYLRTSIDMTDTLAWLTAYNAARPVDQRLLLIAPLVRAVAKAVTEVPVVNGFWIDGGYRPGTGVHIGCAIALRDGGLVAPAVHDADRKSLDDVMRDLMDLVARVRRGSVRSSELSDPTITVTNLGELGVDEAFAVIYPPQVAIVAFGRPSPRPWVVDGRVEARTLITATLSADHRVVDGRKAGQFLSAISRHLQAPEQL
jgi:pyruvate dehydrogenase E2 component (dihydrolipoamide acetyltransferase)